MSHTRSRLKSGVLVLPWLDWTVSAGLSCDLTFKEAARRVF